MTQHPSPGDSKTENSQALTERLTAPSPAGNFNAGFLNLKAPGGGFFSSKTWRSRPHLQCGPPTHAVAPPPRLLFLLLSR